MLESTARRPRRAPGLADEGPGAAAADDPRRAASCGSRSRAGSSSASARRRTTASPRSRRSPRCTPSTAPAGGDPPELRPAPALLRRGAGGDRDRGRGALLAHGRVRAGSPVGDAPEWATPVTIDDMKRAGRGDARADARRRHPDPAEPRRLVAGARRGRRDRPRRAVSANGDHISPEHPFPSPHQVRKRLAQRRASR